MTDVLAYSKRIGKRNKDMAKQKLTDYYMGVLSSNSSEPDKLAKSLVDKMDEIDMEFKGEHAKVYSEPKEGVEGIEKLKQFRKGKGLQ